MFRDRLIDRSDYGATLIKERDERRKKRHPGNKGFRAVHRIQNPDKFGVLAHAAIFLPDDPVFGIARLDDFADAFFGIAVGERYRGGIGLALDFDLGPVVREDLFGGFVAEFHRKGFEGFVLFRAEFRHDNSFVLDGTCAFSPAEAIAEV